MPEITNLILSGGGTNCLSHSGALITLLKQGYLKNLKRVFGCSGGAFVGLGAALNYTVDDHTRCLEQTDISKFISLPRNVGGNISLFFKRFGIFSGKYIRELLNEHLKEKIGVDNATFADLYHYSKIEFYVCAVNQSKKTIKIFSFQETPHTSVALAVQASMALPLFFEAVGLKEVTPGKFVLDSRGDLFGDGGLLDNFPLQICDMISKKQDAAYRKAHSLGLHIVENENQLKWLERNEPPHSRDFSGWLGLGHYLFGLIKTSAYHQKIEAIRLEDMQRLILINVEDLSPINFSLDQQTKDNLIQAGKTAAERYIQKQAHDKDEPEISILRAKL